jgi:hypothetical protein
MAATKKASTGGKAQGSAAGTGTPRITKETSAPAKGAANETKTKPVSNGATATKKAAPAKLNDRQRDFLKKIKDAGELGYAVGPKVEQRTIDALVDRRLAKRLAKDKVTGTHRYLLTKAGEKQLPPPAATPAT